MIAKGKYTKGTHMKVIDIILNEATVKLANNAPTTNTLAGVKKATALIARIDWFLKLPKTNSKETLDPDQSDPSSALTPNKLNADRIEKLGKTKAQLDASITANNGKLTAIIGEFRKWVRKQTISSVNAKLRAETSPTDPVAIFLMHTAPLTKLLASTDDTPVNLSDGSGFPLSLSQVTRGQRAKFQQYIDRGAQLVNIINTNKTPYIVVNATNELIELNTAYVGYKGKGMRQDAWDYARKRLRAKGVAIPAANVKTGSLDYIKQVGIKINNFINSANPDDRLDNNFDYTKLDLDKNDAILGGDDREWLTSLSTSIDNVTTNAGATELKFKLQQFLLARNTRSADLHNWLAKRHGVGKEQQLGELPDDFNETNPLHTTWKELIRSANVHAGRREVDGLYKDFWPTVVNQQWKCYITNLDMVDTDGSPYKISMDRIDSNKSYKPNNVAFCCARVNVLKGNLLNNELIAMCKQILTHNGLLVTRLNENEINDPCQEYANKQGGNVPDISITEKLTTLEKLARCISKNYKDYMYTYEIRYLDEAISVISKENNNPTSVEYANFLYNSPEIAKKIYKLKLHVVNRSNNYRTPAPYLLSGLRDVKRYKYMSFDDFKHDAHRIVKLQPKLRTRVDAAIRDAELFYQDSDQLGQSTIKDKYAEKLSATLTDKYRSQRKREREYNMLGRYELPISARRREKEKVEKYKPTISTDELVTIANAQRGKCAITGLPMSAITDSPDMVSIDRTNSKLGGYSAKNIQLVLRRVNTMKGDLPMKDFLYWCSQIYNNRAAEVTDKDLKAAVLHPLANDKDAIINDKID